MLRRHRCKEGTIAQAGNGGTVGRDKPGHIAFVAMIARYQVPVAMCSMRRINSGSEIDAGVR
jgi:hypothetical protein